MMDIFVGYGLWLILSAIASYLLYYCVYSTDGERVTYKRIHLIMFSVMPFVPLFNVFYSITAFVVMTINIESEEWELRGWLFEKPKGK